MLSSSHSRRLLAITFLALSAVGLESAAGAPGGPAPKLKAAKAVDADRDGSIDGFDLTFSSTVKGKARSKAPFSARVAGYTVTRQKAPNRRTVRVSVAELAGCDLGARPRISVKGAALKGSGGKPVRSSSVVAGKAARGAPRIVCAVTSDSDRDGHLDGVRLTYSKKVRNRAKAAGKLPFEVDRYSVASVGKARGRNLVLKLREKAEFDTDGLPAIIYRKPRARRDRRYAVMAGRTAARSTTFNATRDRATARLLSTRTADGDANGKLDAVEARFSEPVRASGAAVTVDGATVTGLTASERQTIVARLREGGLGSAARPNVTLGAGDSLRDPAGNPTGRLESRAEDGAAPVVVAARTADRGGAPAKLDAVDLTFSEPVDHPADGDGGYPLSLTGYALGSVSAADGPRVTLSVREGTDLDGGARPAVGYTRGAGAAVRDAAGNEAPATTFEGSTDGIVPVLIGAVTLDTDVDGLVDGVRFDFSEPVSHPAGPCPGCSFSLQGYTTQFAGAGSGSSVTVTVNEAGSGGLPVATYAPMGGGVTDVAGNAASGRSLSTADASPPVAVGVKTVDSGGVAGRIDRLDVTFSEPIAHEADTQAPFSLSVAGYNVTGLSAASGRELSITLAEKPAPDTGAAPAISYTGAGGVPLNDLNGTEHAVRSYPGLTRDDVAPVFVEARTADFAPAEGNGRLDAIDLMYSEQIAGDGAGSPYSVTGRTVGGIAYLDDRVRVSFDEAITPDTADRPSISYTPGDLRDLPEGPNDTASPAPGASGQALDAAGPAVVAAQTGDADSDGRLDRMSVTMSEPVTYSAGPPAVTLTQPALTVDSLSLSGSSFTAVVAESGPAQGALSPLVSVPASAPARITDSAGNPAREGPFSGATDGVRPIPVSARTGEEGASPAACGAGVGDGSIDCFRVSWSEAVTQPDTASVFTTSPFTPLSLMATADSPSSDVRVTPGAGADRDRGGSVSYSGGGGVADLSGNPALATSGPLPLNAVCTDTTGEPNDTRMSNNPTLANGSATPQKLCAYDDDWFKVTASSAGEVSALVDPEATVSPKIEIVDASGVVRTTLTPTAGTAVTISQGGLSAGATYWLHIIGAPPTQEGNYCVAAFADPGQSCDDGDGNPS